MGGKFAIYKGLQRPLVFRSFKGKFIYWGVGSLMAGLVLGALTMADIAIYAEPMVKQIVNYQGQIVGLAEKNPAGAALGLATEIEFVEKAEALTGYVTGLTLPTCFFSIRNVAFLQLQAIFFNGFFKPGL